MRKVIAGKVYDTMKARMLCLNHELDTAIFRKKTGEFFAETIQGARHAIRPLTRQEAINMARTMIPPEEVKQLSGQFTPVGDDGSRARYSIALPPQLDEKVRRIAYAKGLSLTEMLRRMAEAYPEE
nr:MAG TPA: Ribbon-helix-helix domain [Caudoviricetes sp.]